jgi:hypothetical protein
MYAKDGLGYDDIFRISLKPEVIAQQPVKTEPVAKTEEQPERDLPKDIVKTIEEPVDQKTKENIVLRTLFFEFNSSVVFRSHKKRTGPFGNGNGKLH